MLSVGSALAPIDASGLQAISRQTMSEGQPGFGCPNDIGAARGSLVDASPE